MVDIGSKENEPFFPPMLRRHTAVTTLRECGYTDQEIITLQYRFWKEDVYKMVAREKKVDKEEKKTKKSIRMMR